MVPFTKTFSIIIPIFYRGLSKTPIAAEEIRTVQKSAFAPFKASDAGKTLTGPYPDKDQLLSQLTAMPPHEHRNFVRLWMLEGIPKAFEKTPIMFDVVREWLSEKIGIHQRNISLIGSARIGYSLAPKKYGIAFTELKSDIDLCMVCPDTFTTITENFHDWKNLVETGRLTAPSPRVSELWVENFRVCEDNINRGFIDLNKVYPLRKYDKLVQINDALYRLTEKINVTPELPKVRKISMRLYRDWPSLVNRNSFNLRLLIQKKRVESSLKEMRETAL